MISTLRQLPIRRSLTRPILLGGGERKLVMINCTLIISLIFGIGINQYTLGCAAFLAVFGQWALIQMAKADPLMSQIYLRHIQYHDYYLAQGSVHAAVSAIKSSVPSLSSIG